jgi:GTPase SAR1 family protein
MEVKNTSDLSLDISYNLVRHKVVFVGDVAVGKTSIINRFIENRFNDTYDVRMYNYIAIRGG